MERLDLYQQEFVKTGAEMLRGEAIEDVPEGSCAMVVFVAVFNSRGELLIQQRHPRKSWGGWWDLSAAGAVSAGESSKEAALRELKEELGLEVAPEEMVKLLSIYYERHIHDIFAVVADVETASLHLQEDEVADARWASREEVLEALAEGRFIPVYKEFMELLFAMKNTRGIMLA